MNHPPGNSLAAVRPAAQHTTALGSRPIRISQPQQQPTRAQPRVMAASAPVMSMQPPPPPQARPRLPSCDPPPMELPPTPPTWSPLQQQQDSHSSTTTVSQQQQGVAVPSAQPVQLQHTQRLQVYSRSMSNYSSSAPSCAPAFLTQHHFQPVMRGIGESDTATQSPLSEEDGSDVSNTLNRSIQAAQQHSELGKSPTVFSILTQGLHSEPVEIGASNIQQQQTILRGIITHETNSTAANARTQDDNQNANDLQFSISLEED